MSRLVNFLNTLLPQGKPDLSVLFASWHICSTIIVVRVVMSDMPSAAPDSIAILVTVATAPLVWMYFLKNHSAIVWYIGRRCNKEVVRRLGRADTIRLKRLSTKGYARRFKKWLFTSIAADYNLALRTRIMLAKYSSPTNEHEDIYAFDKAFRQWVDDANQPLKYAIPRIYQTSCQWNSTDE